MVLLTAFYNNGLLNAIKLVMVIIIMWGFFLVWYLLNKLILTQKLDTCLFETGHALVTAPFSLIS